MAITLTRQAIAQGLLLIKGFIDKLAQQIYKFGNGESFNTSWWITLTHWNKWFWNYRFFNLKIGMVVCLHRLLFQPGYRLGISLINVSHFSLFSLLSLIPKFAKISHLYIKNWKKFRYEAPGMERKEGIYLSLLSEIGLGKL